MSSLFRSKLILLGLLALPISFSPAAFAHGSHGGSEADLEAGGKTKAVELAQKAVEAGVDPSGKTADEINEEIESREE